MWTNSPAAAELRTDLVRLRDELAARLSPAPHPNAMPGIIETIRDEIAETEWDIGWFTANA